MGILAWRKTVVIIVILSFSCLFIFSSLPLTGAGRGDGKTDLSRAPINESVPAGSYEKSGEQGKSVKKKKSLWPLLIAGAGSLGTVLAILHNS